MKGKVTIELGGEERELRFGTSAIMEAEAKLGLSAMTGEIFSSLSIRALVTLTWAALLHSNKRLTIADVVEWVPLEDDKLQGELTTAVVRAWLIGRGKDPDATEKKIAITRPANQEPIG